MLTAMREHSDAAVSKAPATTNGSKARRSQAIRSRVPPADMETARHTDATVASTAAKKSG